MPEPLPRFSDAEIVAARPEKAAVDPAEPYAYLVEPERTARGTVEDVATVFLTNRECPFRCLMCDLWKHTTDETVPDGAIPAQIDFALDRLAPARTSSCTTAATFSIERPSRPRITNRSPRASRVSKRSSSKTTRSSAATRV